MILPPEAVCAGEPSPDTKEDFPPGTADTLGTLFESLDKSVVVLRHRGRFQEFHRKRVLFLDFIIAQSACGLNSVRC